MDQQQALTLLGLEAGADQAAIDKAYENKKVIIAQKHEAAPTDALKQKFADMQKQLDDAREALSVAATPGQSIHRRTPLSETKMADLPNAGPMGDGDQIQLLQPGQVLAGRYEVEEQIGAGGMGAVYRAMDRNTREPVALKVLLPSLTKNERARERFLNEARLSQKLSHPNIVNVYDVQHDGDLYFITMELLEGQDLRQVMENRKLAQQQFTTKELLDLTEQLCNALTYAHKHTVHRDLKPENIWLDDDGNYKLMDFGIAQLQSTSQRTQTGAAMGTAYYMAPEQLRGLKNIDGRADLYAVGVLLYEMASGDVPAGVIKPLREKCPSLPKGFAAAVMQCLQADPEERYANAEALATAVKRKGGGLSIPHLPWKAMSIAAALLVAVGGAGLVTMSGTTDFDVRSLLPMSKEEKSQRRAAIAKIQGEIKVLKERLSNGRRVLDSNVRDAERNGSSNLDALSYWRETTEDFIFNGAEIPNQEGNLSMAEALLRDEAFAQSEAMLIEVRDSYKKLAEDFSAGEHLYDAKHTQDQAKAQWAGLNIISEQPHPEVALAETVEQQAKESLSAGDMAAALSHWRRAAEIWSRAHEAGTAILAKRSDADKARSSWMALKKNYTLNDPDEVAAATDVHERGESQFNAGEFPAAMTSWELAIDLWEQAKTARKSEVAKIDAQRKAAADKAAAAERERIAAEKARLAAEAEAKRKEEERQALLRQKEREIDSLFSSLKSSVRSNGHNERKRSEICFYNFQTHQRWCEHDWHTISLSQSLDLKEHCELTLKQNGYWNRTRAVKLYPAGEYTVKRYNKRHLYGSDGGISNSKAEFNLYWYLLAVPPSGGGYGIEIMFKTESAANEAKNIVTKMADACAYLS